MELVEKDVAGDQMTPETLMTLLMIIQKGILQPYKVSPVKVIPPTRADTIE